MILTCENIYKIKKKKIKITTSKKNHEWLNLINYVSYKLLIYFLFNN